MVAAIRIEFVRHRKDQSGGADFLHHSLPDVISAREVHQRCRIVDSQHLRCGKERAIIGDHLDQEEIIPR
jgi:hypothetical protein